VGVGVSVGGAGVALGGSVSVGLGVIVGGNVPVTAGASVAGGDTAPSVGPGDALSSVAPGATAVGIRVEGTIAGSPMDRLQAASHSVPAIVVSKISRRARCWRLRWAIIGLEV
jgi:hypothetical protein